MSAVAAATVRERHRDMPTVAAAPAPPKDVPSSRGGPRLPGPPQQRVPPPPPPRDPIVVDREKTCPLLLRVFTKVAGHHSVEEFATRGKEPKDEVQIYTWRDATLRELTDLVKEVAPAARRSEAKLSFAFVYPDRRGRNVLRIVGMTYASGGRGGDDMRKLAELGFQTGDFLDVAIY